MTVLDWMPRFVREDNSIVMPEDVRVLHINALNFKSERHSFALSELNEDYPLDRARADRPTGFRDKNGKMIYENDRVAHAIWKTEGVVVVGDDGRWIVKVGDSGVSLHGWSMDWEVTGIVPYAKEGV
jgi:hypothetical protein